MPWRMASCEFLILISRPSSLELPRGDVAVLPEDGHYQLGAPGTHQAGDSEDLTLAQVEADAFNDFGSRIARVLRMEVFHLQDDVAGLAMAFGEALLHLPADHVAHQGFDVEFLRRPGGHHFAVAQHRDRIRNLRELFQFMTDINAGHPCCLSTRRISINCLISCSASALVGSSRMRILAFSESALAISVICILPTPKCLTNAWEGTSRL